MFNNAAFGLKQTGSVEGFFLLTTALVRMHMSAYDT